jgi:hypothetical protein
MCGASIFTVDFIIKVFRGLAKVNSIPKDERIVLLHSNAGVGADLGLQDPGGGTGPLGERSSAFLEQIERI